jgi:hypothetical protein
MRIYIARLRDVVNKNIRYVAKENERPSRAHADPNPTGNQALCISLHGCKNRFDRPTLPRTPVMSNLVHNEQVKLAAAFWNNLAVAALLGVFLVPAFYTRHTMLQQALSVGVGLAAAIGLRMMSHWWLRRLRD